MANVTEDIEDQLIQGFTALLHPFLLCTLLTEFRSIASESKGIVLRSKGSVSSSHQ